MVWAVPSWWRTLNERRTDMNAHETYIAEGGCPSTMPGNDKCWCNGKVTHLGAHWAQRIPTPNQPIGHPNHARVEWIGRTIQACCALDAEPEFSR